MATTADAQGYFTVLVDEPSNCCSLFAGPPYSGPLLGNVFTSTIFGRHGEHHYGLIVPAIPATQLSGHVYDENSKPLSGCEARAITRVPEDQQHPTTLREVGFDKTDKSGAFKFANLGADRYFVLVQCQVQVEWHGDESKAPSPLRIGNSWRPMLYPQADNLNKARMIVLRPGEHLDGIDFHLHSVPQYSVHGSVAMSDGSAAKPWPSAIYLHDLRAVSLDTGLAELDLAPPCDWRTPRDDFNCNLLSPGTYELHFQIDSGLGEAMSVRPQGAEVRVQVSPAISPGAPLRVQLKDEAPPRPVTADTRAQSPATGTLRIQHACPEQGSETWIEIQLYGPRDLVAATHNRGLNLCSSRMFWTLPAGDYKLLGLVPSQANAKVMKLLEAYAQPVTVRAGKSTDLTLRVWTSEEIIRLALDSLGAASHFRQGYRQLGLLHRWHYGA